MRSREDAVAFLWLLRKEYRELIASHAWWVLLLAMGPLVGVTFISAKALILALAWLAASLPGAAAIGLWRAYGGSIYPPEVATVVLGHALNAGLTIALAALTAAVSEHPSTAAILTLSVTVGTWILNFVAAVQGGIWERAAGYTPPAMIATFQHGLVRLDVVLIAALLITAGLVLAAVWIRTGVAVARRLRETCAWSAVAAAAIFACTFATPSWDLSESRANSLPEPDERALAQLHEPLRVEAHLAPEDPRRADLERRALSKLRRVLPRVEVQYVSSTTIGLFEQTRPHYGEIWYELGGRREMSRSTTTEGMLEAIYDLAGIKPPIESDDAIFRGHPLAVPPKGAATVFYGIWPALVVAGAFFLRRKPA